MYGFAYEDLASFNRILLLFYPDLCARVIGIFYCEEVGPSFYMTRDRRFRCYAGDWLAYLPLSILLILLWVVGTLHIAHSRHCHN